MNERYAEYLASRRPNTMYRILAILCGILAFVCLLGIYAVSVIAAVPAILLGIGAWYLFSHSEVEYEYLLLEQELSIDRILNRSSRKQIFSVSVKDIELMAPANSSRCQSWLQRKLPITDYASDLPGTNKYMVVCRGKGQPKLFYFSPGEEMLEQFRLSLSRLVFYQS